MAEPMTGADPTIRPAQTGDRPTVLALVREAFRGGEAEAALVEAIWASTGYVAPLDIVAEIDGRIAGHVLVSRGDLDGAPALGLAPLAVAPEHQKQGIGSALVRKAIRVAEAAGEPLILLLGSPAYYGRFGFEPAGRYGVTAVHWRPPRPEDFQLLRLSGSADGLRGAYRYAWEL